MHVSPHLTILFFEKKSFLITFIYVCAHAYTCVHVGICTEVREQLSEIGFPFITWVSRIKLQLSVLTTY